MSILRSSMADWKFDQPEFRPNVAPKARSIPFFRRRVLPRHRCRRSPPEPPGTSEVGSATTFGTGKAENRPSPSLRDHFQAKFCAIGALANRG